MRTLTRLIALSKDWMTFASHMTFAQAKCFFLCDKREKMEHEVNRIVYFYQGHLKKENLTTPV